MRTVQRGTAVSCGWRGVAAGARPASGCSVVEAVRARARTRCGGTPAGLPARPRQGNAPQSVLSPRLWSSTWRGAALKETSVSASSHRRTPLPPHWARLRRAVMNRNGWVCQHVRYDTGEICAEPARHCDHIVPASEGGSDDPSNLRACAPQ
ncbi:HNH endonuclease [Kitasatospora griseola]|uniref:HNH endonuclease n=1 Tax=Kitasatospora griseola TaxID=2064 RepID=UPI0036DC9590